MLKGGDNKPLLCYNKKERKVINMLKEGTTVFQLITRVNGLYSGKLIRIFENDKNCGSWLYNSDRIVSHYRVTQNYILIYL